MSKREVAAPRIALLHALEESVLPTRIAFARNWPGANVFDLLDTSLAVDLAFHGRLDMAMHRRFELLSDYASQTEGEGGRAQGVLFTCSAFGPAIDVVKKRLSVPVLRPNEAAFEAALDKGRSIGLVVTFGPSLASLTAELEAMAADRGAQVKVRGVIAEGALAALKSGDGERHDRIVAEAVKELPSVDTIVLGQFSLARAREVVSELVDIPVITTPDSAVLALKKRVEAASLVGAQP